MMIIMMMMIIIIIIMMISMIRGGEQRGAGHLPVKVMTRGSPASFDAFVHEEEDGCDYHEEEASGW